MRRLLWLIPLLVGITGAAVAATNENIPGWGRWTLAGIALAGAAVLGIAVLIGPAARRLAGEQHPLTQAERGEMTATERVEAVNSARHTLIQAATGLVVIGGVVFTAQGLWYTAQSLDASLQAQRTAEQGQITDRYTKAAEQLGSSKRAVRLGGLYALERLAQDSPRDHQAVYDVLAAFVREYDPKSNIDDDGRPLALTADVQAALTVIGRRDVARDTHAPSFLRIRTPLAGLFRANLDGADLRSAQLLYADLRSAKLRNANAVNAKVRDAILTDADLTDADLALADLTRAVLTRAVLTDADLTSAVLRGAILTGADLTGADLTGADLRGADLTGVRGITEDEIRKVARIDQTTTF
ncbi:pentapeptide repeat-containing protein [Nonomuraea sp. B19D2]|uniref:pentapeptide repeat-containing protein n=1 Tax=Nonomuraea sp. B19D2 TaxID=3159561 RepID=UPI0032DB8FDA